jgi:hypothetical protein
MEATPELARALLGKAEALVDLGQREEAIAVFAECVARFGDARSLTFVGALPMRS